MSLPTFRDVYAFCCSFFIFLTICQVIQAIHEDQVGLNDWSLQFIGRPFEVLVSATRAGSSKQLVYAYTEQNVLAAIDLKNKDIVWRQIFESHENGTVSSGVLLDDEVCVLISRGRLLRCFDTLTGIFKWEKSFNSPDGYSGRCLGVWDGKDKKNINPITGIACANDDRLGLFSRNGNTIWESKCAKARKRFIFQSQSGEVIAVGLNENKFAVKRYVAFSGEAKGAGFDRSAIVNPATTDCRLVQPAAQVLPFVVCYDASTNRLTSQSVGDSDKSQSEIRLDKQIDFFRESSDEVLLHSFAVDGLFAVSSNGESLLLQLTADGQFRPVKKISGIFMASSESDLLTVELTDDRVSVGSSKFDGTSLVPHTDEIQTFVVPPSFGDFRNAIVVPTRDGTPSKPAFVFWTEGDVVGYASQGKLAWDREEGLAKLTVAAIVDLPISDIEALVEEEFEEKGSFLVRFSKRLISQGLQLKKLIELSIKRVMSGLRIGKFQKEQLERDFFNTHKIIVAATDNGKVFGLDSRNGDVIYSLLIKKFGKPKDRSIQFYMQRTGAHAPFPSQAVLVGADKSTGDGMLFFFDCITGEQLDQAISLPSPVLQSGLIPVMNSNHLEAIFVLDSDLSLSIFPNLDSTEISDFVKNSLHLMDVCSKTGVARGYRAKLVNKSWKAVEVWSATLLGNGESILAVAPKRPHDFVHSQGRVLADRRVLYKYINPNLVAVSVQGTDEAKKPYIKVIGLDGVTGRIVFSQIHRRAKGPCFVAHSEYWIMYTYWNEKVRSNEIGIVEMYRGFEKPNKTFFSSLESFEKPELSAAAFKLPGFINAIADTVTVEGITHKNLIVALSSGSVAQIPKVFLDPRRPMFPTQAEREEGLIPYAPELPLVTENIINYYKKVYRIRGIKTGGAGLESISLVFAYGLDLFFTRVTPSALFDVLSDSFDYWILTVVMLVMTIASAITRHMANAKALEQAWK